MTDVYETGFFESDIEMLFAAIEVDVGMAITLITDRAEFDIGKHGACVYALHFRDLTIKCVRLFQSEALIIHF